MDDSFSSGIAHALDPVAFAIDRLGFKPDRWQERAMRSQKDTLLNCCRQSGKSTTTGVIAVHQAKFNPGSLTLLSAPTQRQSKLLFDKVAQNLKRLEPVEELEVDNRLSCKLANGSEIVALPGDPDNLRGYSGPSLIVLDEAAFFDDDGMLDAVTPMLATSSGRLMLISTGNGQRGFYWDAWMNGGSDWERIVATADDCPRIPKSEIEKAKRRLTPSRFRQEYYAEFSSTEDQVFGYEIVQRALDPELKPIFTPSQLAMLNVTPRGGMYA